jgi:predicted dehydrogenase
VRSGTWKESGAPDEAGGVLHDLGSHVVDQALVLFGPAERVYAEVTAVRAGAAVPDDAFVAITHASGTTSHLWMSAVAADLGPRFRALGSAAAYVVRGLDGQEARLRASESPAQPGWGVEPEESWGRLGVPGAAKAHPTLPGDYPAFYAELTAHLRGQGPVPVDPEDAVEALAVIEAAQASARDRRVVGL